MDFKPCSCPDRFDKKYKDYKYIGSKQNPEIKHGGVEEFECLICNGRFGFVFVHKKNNVWFWGMDL